jgi:hypothetical protein
MKMNDDSINITSSNGSQSAGNWNGSITGNSSGQNITYTSGGITSITTITGGTINPTPIGSVGSTNFNAIQGNTALLVNPTNMVSLYNKGNEVVVSFRNDNNVKDTVSYIIVQKNNRYLELEILQTITPKEMIGITQFISVVQVVVNTGLAGAVANTNAVLTFDWSKLAKSLGIEKHFKPIVYDPLIYDTPTPTLYFFLFDPQ